MHHVLLTTARTKGLWGSYAKSLGPYSFAQTQALKKELSASTSRSGEADTAIAMATQSGPLSAEVAALLHDLKAFGAFSEEAYDVIWGAVEVREDGCVSHDDAHVVFRLAGMTRKQASALICAVRDEAGQIFIENIAADHPDSPVKSRG